MASATSGTGTRSVSSVIASNLSSTSRGQQVVWGRELSVNLDGSGHDAVLPPAIGPAREHRR